MQLINFDKETFLRDYWQQKPLLIKNPWREWSNPLEPDELAGAACEDGIESRLIIEQRGQWIVEHGPVPEDRFAKLPKTHWSLLVQAVDHYVPEVADLLEAFRFIPNWRIDDVMVSYAADQGGVGPHYDQYDVFLIQGLGTRRWQVGGLCHENTPLQPNDQLRLLAAFNATEEWVLEPGDILYLPPRYAHNGVALGDNCMTYSIGFRAPSRGELIANWSDYVLADLNDDDRYVDPGLHAAANPGEIPSTALATLQRMAVEKLQDADTFREWFGRYSTLRKYAEENIHPEQPINAAELVKLLRRGETLLRNPASRFSFTRAGANVFARTGAGVQLFVDGEMFACNDQVADLATQLCAQTSVSIDADMLKSATAVSLLVALFNQGSIGFADDD